MSRRILMVTRLMSGFVSSIQNGQWLPSGSPALYHLIDYLDTSDHYELSLVLTLKNQESMDPHYLNRPLSLQGLSVCPVILPGPMAFPRFLGRIAVYLSECRQCWRVWRFVKKMRPDRVYIDRANVLLGAVIARWTNTPVHWRLLGVPPSLQTVLDRPAISHTLYRWAYRSPFRMVVCSKDGSPGVAWMRRALHWSTPSKHWLNGVDSVSSRSQGVLSVMTVVLVGRLNPLKRVDQLVLALLKLPRRDICRMRIHVIGEGEQLPFIRQQVAQSPYADRFILHGAMPHQAVLQQLAQSDVFISFNTHGNLTNTVLEAMRCGLCVLLPVTDALSTIDQDTDALIANDLVVRFKQDPLLADLTYQLCCLARSPERLHTLQARARQWSDCLESWKQRIQKEALLFQPYDRVLVLSDLQGGGTQKVVTQLIYAWASQGRRVAVVSLDVVERDCFVLPDSVDRIAIGGVSSSSTPWHGLIANLKRVQRLRLVLKRLSPRCVVSFLTTTNVLAILALRGLDCRLIVSERNDPFQQRLPWVWEWLRRRCYRWADAVTVNSPAALSYLTSFVDRTRCCYLPNPLSLPDQIKPVCLKRPTILSVGRLHEQKAHDVLIEAFYLFYATHPDWQLIILGEGPLRPLLERQIARLGLNTVVHLKGYTDPFPYYASAQLYALVSRYEGMPNVLLEALAMGLPAVISDVLTGPLNFIHDRREAWVVPVDNAEALSQAFAVLANDPVLCQSLAVAGKQAVQPFFIDKVLPAWEALLNA